MHAGAAHRFRSRFGLRLPHFSHAPAPCLRTLRMRELSTCADMYERRPSIQCIIFLHPASFATPPTAALRCPPGQAFCPCIWIP